MICKNIHKAPQKGQRQDPKRQKNLSFALVIAVFAVLMMPQVAHAGFFEWLDRATTFHEDQKRPLKPEILPKGPPAPLLYDSEKADRWNQYYTRRDLVPVRQMDGSATMAMRPRNTAEAQEYGYVLDRNGNPILGPGGLPITGYSLVQRRAAMNKAKQNQGRLFIGEPDHIPQRQEANLGVKTKIGAPIQDWRDQDGQMHFNPQPGDFDFHRNQQRRLELEALPTFTDPPRNTGGMRGDRHMQRQASRDGVNGVPFDPQFDENFPNNYTVQKGDTLSGISNKDRIYGDWKMWPLIHDANRSQISHPDVIFPDQRFDIPRDYTVDDAEQARGRSLPPYDWAN